MTKGALMTMTRNLADAHAAEHIRINQLNVGWTLTENERRQKEIDGLGSDWEADLPKLFAPSGRIFRPHEIAAHAVFWLSDMTGPVTGTVYEIEQHPFIGRNPDKVLFQGARA
jgi:NAD(P)-dependent dehydrogenase (short-subunit alcohol dehydrogenase family)